MKWPQKLNDALEHDCGGCGVAYSYNLSDTQRRVVIYPTTTNSHATYFNKLKVCLYYSIILLHIDRV